MDMDMDMDSRNQYLKEIEKEYLKIKSKKERKERGKLLGEAKTDLERRYLIKKLKPKNNLVYRVGLK